MEQFANIGIYISYVLIAIASLGLLAGVVIAILQNFKEGGMAAIIGLVAIIVFFGIGYALSTDSIPKALMDKGFNDASAYKLSGAGIITFYIMAIVASILLVVDLVKGFIDGN